MSQWKQCDLKCWTLTVGRWALKRSLVACSLLSISSLAVAEEAQLLEVSGQALNRHRPASAGQARRGASTRLRTATARRAERGGYTSARNMTYTSTYPLSGCRNAPGNVPTISNPNSFQRRMADSFVETTK